ncbi:MAG: hypothetical protein KGN34_02590 [Sphingomonadales bacterium]|nr:hypothetical protein [Sphingomonadales bacterium]
MSRFGVLMLAGWGLAACLTSSAGAAPVTSTPAMLAVDVSVFQIADQRTTLPVSPDWEAPAPTRDWPAVLALPSPRPGKAPLVPPVDPCATSLSQVHPRIGAFNVAFYADTPASGIDAMNNALVVLSLTRAF